MIIRSEKWNEEYYYEKLSNGLEVYLMKKPEYKKTYGKDTCCRWWAVNKKTH